MSEVGGFGVLAHPNNVELSHRQSTVLRGRGGGVEKERVPDNYFLR
jgi:hypothetical protein